MGQQSRKYETDLTTQAQFCIGFKGLRVLQEVFKCIVLKLTETQVPPGKIIDFYDDGIHNIVKGRTFFRSFLKHYILQYL